MKAALIYAPGDLRVGDVACHDTGPDDVLVKVHACGVCPSDMRYYAGQRQPARTPPYTPGHEWAGTVEVVGTNVTGLAVGDRVTANPRVVCGHCFYCGRGMSNYCENLRRTVRGGFAEYGVGPASTCTVSRTTSHSRKPRLPSRWHAASTARSTLAMASATPWS